MAFCIGGDVKPSSINQSEHYNLSHFRDDDPTNSVNTLKKDG